MGLEKPVGTSTNLNNVRFTMAKLVPGTTGSPDQWVSYYAPFTSGAGYERIAAKLESLGSGSYRYTFNKDVTTLADYDKNATHRLGIRFSAAIPGTAIQMKNSIAFTKDFVPAGGTVTSHVVTTKAACLECHGTFESRSGGHLAYADPKMCVLCHTDQWRQGQTASTVTGTAITPPAGTKNTDIVRGESLLNFVNLIHKSHMGTRLALTGYAHNNGGFLPNDFNYAVVQDQGLCVKCHTKTTESPEGNSWMDRPSRQACGSCHDGIDWATGTGSTVADRLAQMTAPAGTAIAMSGHVGRSVTSDATCFICHDAVAIAGYHVQNNKTAHNPTIPAGLVNFTYEVKSAAVNATTNNVTIVFKISKDGTPVTFLAPAAAMANPLTGFTGSPGFLLAYALPQDNVTAAMTPVDYNNLGQNAAQPISVSLANLLDTTKAATVGTLAGPDTSGYYTATIVSTATPATNKAFPVGAKMRSVSLQGYFTQISPAAARHAIAVVTPVTGDSVRRKVVDPAKCGNCHEWFEGHGGNRVYETQVCVVCHVPNLSTSGRGISDAALTAYAFNTADVTILTKWGFNKTLPQAALNFPEDTNNFKEMIHGIHAGADRTTPMTFVRDRTPSAIMIFDVYKVGFPGILKNCQSCHLPNTTTAGYNQVPANALWTNTRTTTGADTTTAIAKAARVGGFNAGTFPNTTDLVTSPFTAACVSCHDSAPAQSHMMLNNGKINVSRSAVAGSPTEACVVCHGSGASEDVDVVHDKTVGH